jgi:outer membrane lipoprotein SlyB
MLVITDLKKNEPIDFVTLNEEELLILGGIVPFAANLVGAGLGAIGGGIGAAASNIVAGKSPLSPSTAAGAVAGGIVGLPIQSQELVQPLV